MNTVNISLKVGSFIWSIIINMIIPSGKAYKNINPKYFMPLIFLSVVTILGVFLYDIDASLKKDATTILTMDVCISKSILAIIQFFIISNIISNSLFNFFKVGHEIKL